MNENAAMKLPISVVILAKNEEANIEECLKSVHGWAGEIVIVDDESTDRTRQICSRYTDKIVTRRMELEGKQRNFGADHARFDWVIMLDCDERLTPELKSQIEAVVAQPQDTYVAYWAPKINYLGKVLLAHGGWSNPHIKLYDRRFVRWCEAAYDVVHPGVIIQPGYKGRNLTGPYLHYNYADIEDFIKKENRYTTLEAIKWHVSGRKMSLARALFRTVDRFWRRFIRRKGYKDGFYGFIAAVIASSHELISYAKLREIKDFKAQQNQ